MSSACSFIGDAMRILIRTLEKGATGVEVASDRVVDADVVRIGRATDQQIQSNDPRIGLQHARLIRSDGVLSISCVSPAQAEVNGRLCRDSSLRVGDEVILGPMLIRVLEAPANVDAAISIERDVRASMTGDDIPLPAFATSLDQVGWRKRPWAWGGIAITLLLGLILPSFFVARGDASAAWLRASILPSDMQWTSGALHSAHGNLEVECEACHAQPFRRVRNEQCLDCHASALHQHVPADHPAAAEMTADRCTTCHVEHDEPSNLVQLDTRICTECHAEPKNHGSGSRALSVTDFASAHPDFQVSLLTSPDWKISRARLGESKLIERSNLEFTHAAHLDPDGIKAPQGKVVMECADCHAPSEGGATFKPITMEQHCSTCHSLGFDPAEPKRTVPHGDPQLVMQTLLDHYSRRFLGGYSDPLARAEGVVPPGASLSAAARARALGSAKQRAHQVAADIFERRACADCHAVTRAGTPADPAWSVAPVKLTQTFMPKARFDHAAHSSGDVTCSTCHAAAESKLASDVLMPQIEVCRDCHGGETGLEGGRTRIASPCATCHVYHDSGESLWVPVVKKVIRRASVSE
jgi:predicted CXXCH cytochrome family protein